MVPIVLVGISDMTLNFFLHWEKHHGFLPSRNALEQGRVTPETLKHKHPPCICITYPPEDHHEPPKVVVCRCFFVSHAAFTRFQLFSFLGCMFFFNP